MKNNNFARYVFAVAFIIAGLALLLFGVLLKDVLVIGIGAGLFVLGIIIRLCFRDKLQKKARRGVPKCTSEDEGLVISFERSEKRGDSAVLFYSITNRTNQLEYPTQYRCVKVRADFMNAEKEVVECDTALAIGYMWLNPGESRVFTVKASDPYIINARFSLVN